jgi:glycosyltransferase involved in cell wall biosynthesis
VQWLRDVCRLDDRQRVIVNALGAADAPGAKRALVIYVTRGFRLAPDDPRLFVHQNLRQCTQIVEALGRRGFVTDVIDVRNGWFRARHPYDLVLANRTGTDAFDSLLARKPIVIYLATTQERRRHNHNLRERHRRLVERGRQPVRLRRLFADAAPIFECATAIAVFGHAAGAGWRTRFTGPVLPFNNYGFRETAYVGDAKDYASAARHFLYFASGSQMQKGLDLLLEVFPNHPDLHLHVCSTFEREPDFCESYRQELYETPNIHPVGFVPVNGPQFYDLIRRCAWVIHPTCSDAQPGSVVQCTYAGAVPIVTREAGLDVADFGVLLDDDSLDGIERAILRAAATAPEDCLARTRRARAVCEREFSEAAFAARWDAILEEIIPGADTRAAGSA